MDRKEFEDLIDYAYILRNTSWSTIQFPPKDDSDYASLYGTVRNCLDNLMKYERIARIPEIRQIEVGLRMITEKSFLTDKRPKGVEIINKNLESVVQEAYKIAQEVKGPLNDDGIQNLTKLIRNFRNLKSEWEDLLGKPDVTISECKPLSSKFLSLLKDIKSVDKSRSLDVSYFLTKDNFNTVLEDHTRDPEFFINLGLNSLEDLVREMREEYNISENMLAISEEIMGISKPNQEEVSVQKIPKNVELLEKLYNLNEDKLRARSKVGWPVKEPYDVLQNMQRNLTKYLFSTSAAETGEPPQEDQEIYSEILSLTTELKKHIANPHLNELQVAAIDEFSHSLEAYLKRKIEIIVPNYFARRGIQS